MIPMCHITINYNKGFLISQPSFNKIIHIEFDFTNFGSFFCRNYRGGNYCMIIDTNEFSKEFNLMIDRHNATFYVQRNSSRILRLDWPLEVNCKYCGGYNCDYCETQLKCPWCRKNIFMYETMWWNKRVDVCFECFVKHEAISND